MYRRIRDSAHQSDPELRKWLGKANPGAWEALAWLVGNQYVPVDLYHHVELNDALDAVPEPERGFLESCAELAVAQERKYLADVSRMATALNACGIIPTLFKGSALIAAGYFRWKGLRYIGDIDFVVPPGELDKAVDALEEADYRFEILLPRPIEAYWHSKHDLPSMWHEKGFLRLECHVRPMNKTVLFKAPIDTSALVNNARQQMVDGSCVNIPCPEHLVVHAFYHSQLNDMYELAGTDNYRAMIDVSTVVERTGESFDWKYVKELIRSIKAEKSFALFVDRIAHCVDSRALEWPVAKTNIQSKKLIYAFSSKQKSVSLPIYAVTRFGKELWLGLSRDRRSERALLFAANPKNVDFAPRWRQLLSTSVWSKRVRWVTGMAGLHQ